MKSVGYVFIAGIDTSKATLRHAVLVVQHTSQPTQLRVPAYRGSFMLRAGMGTKIEIPSAARHAIDAQPSPRTARQPEITQGASTPRARAAFIEADRPVSSHRRHRRGVRDETHNIAP